MSLQVGSIENYAAIIDSIACAGQEHGKSRISLVLIAGSTFSVCIGLKGFWMRQYPV